MCLLVARWENNRVHPLDLWQHKANLSMPNPVTGGEVTKLLIVDDEHSLAVWRGLHWTPDGEKILFTITILGIPPAEWHMVCR